MNKIDARFITKARLRLSFSRLRLLLLSQNAQRSLFHLLGLRGGFVKPVIENPPLHVPRPWRSASFRPSRRAPALPEIGQTAMRSED
jgi:hypothetical protein